MLKKGLAVAVILLFVSTCIIPSVSSKTAEQPSIPVSNGNTLYVGGTGEGNYTKIQDAIDNASNGDTVFVYDDSSPYHEELKIRKSITLIGEEKNTTVIDGTPYTYFTIMALANNITILNLSIYGNGGFGINIQENHFITIKNNIFDNSASGIRNAKSTNNIISNNIFLSPVSGIYISSNFYNNKIINNTFYGNGIEVITLSKHYNNTISGNTLNGKLVLFFENQSNKIIEDDVGQIILFGCNNITIRNQELENAYAGVTVYESENIIIENNSILSCVKGIVVHDSVHNCNIKIINNFIKSCDVGCYISNVQGCYIAKNEISFCRDKLLSYGIIIFESPFCNVSNNIINFNHIGIYLLSTVNTSITSNEISNNSIRGIKLSECENNQIRFNNFKRNSLPIVGDAVFTFDTEHIRQNLWYSNYWGRPRFLPKLIIGSVRIQWSDVYLPVLNFDWRPAQEPYDIGG